MQFEFTYADRPFRFRTYSEKDAIACRMRKYGTFYEQDLLEYSLELLRAIDVRDGVVVDVGANFGNHSTCWSALSGLPVVSIEANPQLVPILTENLQNNASPQNSHVIAGGAGIESGQGRMRLTGRAAGQWGLGSVERVSSDDAEETFAIETVTEWLSRTPFASRTVRMLKVDVEGAEVDVLNGAAEILNQHRPEIFVETATDEARSALDACLVPFGYTRLNRFCSTPTWHYTTIRHMPLRWQLRSQALAARLRWRLHKLRHSVVTRLRPAA